VSRQVPLGLSLGAKIHTIPMANALAILQVPRRPIQYSISSLEDQESTGNRNDSGGVPGFSER
jgi:hypothetical protein